MIRTLLTLHPGTKQDGTRCLKGELSRALTTTDDHGTERTYPQGTRLTLVKNHASGTYSQLLAAEAPRMAALHEYLAAEVERQAAHWRQMEADL